MTAQDSVQGAVETDFDQLPADVLRQRVRTLTAEQLESVIAYEQVRHGRGPLTEMARQRLHELRDDSKETDRDTARP